MFGAAAVWQWDSGDQAGGCRKPGGALRALEGGCRPDARRDPRLAERGDDRRGRSPTHRIRDILESAPPSARRGQPAGSDAEDPDSRRARAEVQAGRVVACSYLRSGGRRAGSLLEIHRRPRRRAIGPHTGGRPGDIVWELWRLGAARATQLATGDGPAGASPRPGLRGRRRRVLRRGTRRAPRPLS